MAVLRSEALKKGKVDAAKLNEFDMVPAAAEKAANEASAKSKAEAKAEAKAERAKLTKASWDQRDSADESWRLLLMGAPSGTFVVREKNSSSGGRSADDDVLAVLTVVKPGGGAHFNQLITRSSDPLDGVKAVPKVVERIGLAVLNYTGFTQTSVKLDGSPHSHSSIEELVKFYQDPLYFAQATELDVPAVLVTPSFDGTGVNVGGVGGGGGGGGGAGSTMTMGKKGRKARGKGKFKGGYKSSRLKTLCADGEIKTMWWRKDETGVTHGMVAMFGGGGGGTYGTLYGNIYDDEDGGTSAQQMLFSRMVSGDGSSDSTFNPLAGLGAVTAPISFTEAIALLDDHCTGSVVAESATALAFATGHANVGSVQHPGAEAVTVDDIAFLHMYTMETDFYTRLNQELGGYGRGASHDALESFLPTTKLLAGAMAKLAPLTCKLFRGVKMNYKAILGEDVKVKDRVTWNQFTSCSTSPDVLKDTNFLGPKTEGTVFQIMGVTGINIKAYSAISDEDEIVLPPGSQFVIEKITPWKYGVTEVRMRQVIVLDCGGGGAARSTGAGDTSSDVVSSGAIDTYDDVDDYLACT